MPMQGLQTQQDFILSSNAISFVGPTLGQCHARNAQHIHPCHTIVFQTLPKAQRTRGLSSGYQIKFFKSYHKFSNKSLSDFIFIFSTKQQLQNFNQISALRLNINFKILTKRIFWVSTKNNLHNLNQGSAAKYWLNFSFKISHELQLQNLDQTLCSKSGQKFYFMTKLQLPNLHQLSSNHF